MQVMPFDQRLRQPFQGLVAEVPWAVWGVAGMIALLATARPAGGQVWVDVNELDGKLPSWVDPQYVKPPPPREEPRVEPVPEPPSRPGWVWVPPTVRVVYERVWVPPRYDWRDVRVWENGRWVVRRAWVEVEPGRYETRRREVLVPGHWERIDGREPVPMPMPMPHWRGE